MPRPTTKEALLEASNQEFERLFSLIEPLKEVVDKLKDSHQKVIEIIDSHTNEELFTKQRYAWTGTTSLGSYTISSTSSHYDWASKIIKKFLKSL